jgi:hypothetical protein
MGLDKHWSMRAIQAAKEQEFTCQNLDPAISLEVLKLGGGVESADPSWLLAERDNDSPLLAMRSFHVLQQYSIGLPVAVHIFARHRIDSVTLATILINEVALRR